MSFLQFITIKIGKNRIKLHNYSAIGCPSSNSRYFETACSSSEIRMNSSAVCERSDIPGPNLNDGHSRMAWSESVGDPNGLSPRLTSTY